jgi:hypothetical protein
MNGDSLQDLIIMAEPLTETGNMVEVYLGDSTLQAYSGTRLDPDLAIWNPVPETERQFWSLAVGDLNGDGLDDIVTVANPNAVPPYFLVVHGQTDWNALGISTCDVDQTPATQCLYGDDLLPGNGVGYTLLGYDSCNELGEHIILADFNQDGRLDILSSSSQFIDPVYQMPEQGQILVFLDPEGIDLHKPVEFATRLLCLALAHRLSKIFLYQRVMCVSDGLYYVVFIPCRDGAHVAEPWAP